MKGTCFWVGLAAALFVTAHATVAADVPVGLPIEYRLPTDGPLPRTYRVTLAITSPKDPKWILSTFLTGAPRTVTAENNGRFTEVWNGLDENFMPLPPGNYGVKGIYMPAEKWEIDGEYHTLIAHYRGGPCSWLPKSKDDLAHPKIFGDPVRSGPGDLALIPDGKGVFLWEYLENGLNNFLVDLTKPIGPEQIDKGFASGSSGGGDWVTFDGTSGWATYSRLDAPGIYRIDNANFTKDRTRFLKRQAPVVGLCAWRDAGNRRSVLAIAERGGNVAQVRLVDGASGENLVKLPLEGVGALAFREQQLYALQKRGGKWVILRVPVVNGLPKGEWSAGVPVGPVANPTAFAVDSKRRFAVCDQAANQVYLLDKDGKLIRRLGRVEKHEEGTYDPKSFLEPHRVACWTDKEGKDRIVVLEHAGFTRMSEWTADGTLSREWNLFQSCNTGWAIDPEDPSQVYLQGSGTVGWLVRYRVDHARGVWTPDAAWSGLESHAFIHDLEVLNPSILHHKGRTYFAMGRPAMLHRFDGKRLVPSAGIVAQKSPDNRSTRYYAWNDDNGDGIVQEAEWRSHPLPNTPGGAFGYWGTYWQPNLSILTFSGADVVRLVPDGLDSHGNPRLRKWEVVARDPVYAAKRAGAVDALHGGNEVGSSFCGDWQSGLFLPDGGLVTNNAGGHFSANESKEQKITRYEAVAGGGQKIVWRVGRSALFPGAQGQIVGSIRTGRPIHGLLPVIDQTRAGVHLYTVDEGLYVDTLLPNGTYQLKSMYRSPGEFFGGNCFLDPKSGSPFIEWGKEMPIAFEVPAWKKDLAIHKVTGLPRSVELTTARTSEPPELALRIRGGAGKAKVAHFLPAVGAPPARDGSLNGWEACEPIIFGQDKQQIEVRCLFDLETIYLRWQVRGSAPVNVRPLDAPERLFTHDRGADTLGFYFQGDPNARGTPADGRPGDVRFVFGLFEQKGATVPVALGMYPTWDQNGPAQPVEYRTPWEKVRFAHVGLVQKAVLSHRIDDDRKGYVLVAAIPRSALPRSTPAWTDGFRTSVNFDANFGGNLKTWWSIGDGSANRETNDEPTEARLYTASWAQASFASLKSGLVIRSWQAIGPFGFADMPKHHHINGRNEVTRVLFNTAFPPEKGIDLAAAYKGDMTQTRKTRRELKWRPFSLTQGDRVVLKDALKDFGWPNYEDEGAAYLATWVFTPAAAEVKLVATTGHGHFILRGWLNGTAMPIVFDKEQFPRRKDERLDPTTTYKLNAGWNEVLLRYDHVWGDVFVGVRVEAPAETLWKLRISKAKPAKQP